MRRQHTLPYLIEEEVYQLKAVNGVFDENWLQEFIFKHQETLPISEFEPAFGTLIPVCRELRTKAGPIDMLFINSLGLLTLVECKLWKNPEARREVVGQILDYAKEITKWTYDDLQKTINEAKAPPGVSLYELVEKYTEELDQANFIDMVSRNMRRGRFLLLIVGDGIREGVEQIADFLQRHAYLNFSFGLIELGIYQLPDQSTNRYFVQPRILAQTYEIERSIVRIEDDRITSLAPSLPKTGASPRRTKITEQVLLEKVEIDIGQKVAKELKFFLDKVQSVGLYVEPGENSLMLKSNLYNFNFAVIRTNNSVHNIAIADKLEKLGYPQIGDEYLNKFASLFDDGYVDTSSSRFNWTVKIKSGNRCLTISEFLSVQEKWLELIKQTLNELAEQTGEL